MREILKAIFRLKEGRQFDLTKNGSWGRSVQFKDEHFKDVYGWLTPLPQRGDTILFKMESGKIGKYQFTDVRPCGDPTDMFFGTVKGLGYVTEKQTH